MLIDVNRVDSENNNIFQCEFALNISFDDNENQLTHNIRMHTKKKKKWTEP